MLAQTYGRLLTPHDCLRNRIQAMHKQLRISFRNLIVPEFSVVALRMYAQCKAAITPEKRNANLVHLKSAIFDGRWSLSEKGLVNSDITLMLDPSCALLVFVFRLLYKLIIDTVAEVSFRG